MVHGVAGFQGGCRCAVCVKAESVRMERIGRQEVLRWEPINARAEQVWEQQHEPSALGRQWKHWTEFDIEYALDRSRSVQQVARTLGRSHNAVNALRSKHRNHEPHDGN